MRDPKYANSITANTKVESVNLNFMFIQSTRENKWREIWIYYSTFILFLNFIINVLIFRDVRSAYIIICVQRVTLTSIIVVHINEFNMKNMRA